MSLVCCFGCLSICGCKNVLCRRLVFFPPKPMYALEEKDGKQIMYFVTDEGEKRAPYSSKNFSVCFIPSEKTDKIAIMNINYPNSKYIIMFSHGNATDCGAMRDHLIDMAIKLKISIVCYDYSGYGLSSGKSSETNTLYDAEAVFNWIKSELGRSEDEIILYGQSLGSGPSLHLSRTNRVRGVVLHSGLMSGLRVIREIKKTSWFDIFANIDKVKECESPVFVIHGDEDEDIPFHHGVNLYNAAPNKYDLWRVKGGGHNNIEIHWREEFFRQMKAFLAFLSSGGPPPRTFERDNATPLTALKETV